MPCELWVGGYGRVGTDRYSAAAGTYYEFLVSVPTTIPSSQISVSPTQSNPNLSNASYDTYNHTQPLASGGCPYPGGYWQISRPPKYFYKGSCPPSVLPTQLDPSQPHDCINGNCLPSTTYKTMGFYSNLADCQSGCAKNSKCAGECVPQNEIENLRTAVTKLRSRICK